MKDYVNSVKEEMNWGSFSKYRSFIMGVAAVFIVIFHSGNFVQYAGLYYTLVDLFNMGVEIFLFVSGVGLYFAYEKKPRFRDYYIKRILNVYLVGLVCSIPYTICMNLVINNNGIFALIKDLGGISFVLGKGQINWYTIFVMVLYIVYPLIYKALKFLQKKKLDLPVTLLVCVLWVALCFLLNYKFNNIYMSYEIALTRVPIFLIGCYCGKLVFEKRRFTIVEPIIVIFGIIIWIIYKKFLAEAINSYLSSINSDTLITGRFSKLSLSISVIFILLLFACAVKIDFIHKIFNYIGSLSLELYLLHTMADKCLVALEKNNIIYYIGNIVISFILSIFLSKLRKVIISKYTAKIKNKTAHENQILQ